MDKVALIMLEENKVQLLLELVRDQLAQNPHIVPLSAVRLLLKRLSQEGLKEEHDNVSICEIINVVCEKCNVVQTLMGICV